MWGKRTIAVLFFCISTCASDNTVAESKAVLDPDGQLLLKWQVDYAVQKIRFEVTISEQAPPFNWFALGFSDRGELVNSDECLFWTDYYGLQHYEDMHADESGDMTRDARQNCEQFFFDRTTRTITFERLFDTCDKDDYVIEDGTVHIIWARGNNLLASSNNLCLTCTPAQDHGFIRVRLLVPVYKPNIGNAEPVAFTINNVPVPPVTITYWCKIMRQPEYLDQQVYHIVQYDSIITPGNEDLVHHVKLVSCNVAHDADIPLYEGSYPNRPQFVRELCVDVKVVWARGAGPFTYPEEAGLPIGGPGRSRYHMLEIHYHNQALRSDAIDSSGLMLYIGERRPYDAALMDIGVHNIERMAIPAGQKAFTWSGYCIQQCTGVGLPIGGIKVFGSHPHAHLTGRAVWMRHARLGVELPLLDKDMHYSTHFQQIRLLHEPVIVLPGDLLVTTCLYNTEDTEIATVGGFRATREMCGNFIHYYPASELQMCKSSVSMFSLLNYFDFERRWNNVSLDVYGPPQQNYLAIHPWTPDRVETLHTLYTEFPIDMICNKSEVVAFQGDWREQDIPKIEVPLPQIPRVCPDPVTGL